jgi:hypothetical protein
MQSVKLQLALLCIARSMVPASGGWPAGGP